MMTTTVLLAVAIQCLAPDSNRVEAIAAHLPESPGWARASYAADLELADKLLKEPIPDCPDELYLLFTTTGDREQYQKGYGDRVKMLMTMIGAARVTGENRYLRRVIDCMTAICDERSWVMPAHDFGLVNFNGTMLTIDLGSSKRALVLSAALSQLGDRLPAALREKAMAELERRVFAVYRATNRDSGDNRKLGTHKNWWFFVRSNWSAVCHANVVQAALAVLKDRRDRAEFVEASERGMRFFLESFLDDGYCTEGMGYWNYGFGHFLELNEAIVNATNGFVDYSKMPQAKLAMKYAFGYTLDGKSSPAFADGGCSFAAPCFLDLGCKFWPELKPLRNAALPLRTLFPCAQVYIGRSLRIAFSIKGGNNDELHNHNDLGSWSLLVDGKMIAGDPGSEIYTARTFSKDRYQSDMLNSYGHPVPKVGGELQLVGKEVQAKIVRQEFSADRDIIAFDISSAYSLTRGSPNALIREVVFDRIANSVTIVDRLHVAKPVAFESAVVTGESACPLKPSATGGQWHVVANDFKNLDRPSPHRHAVVFNEPVSEATVTWRYVLKEDN